MPPHRARFRTPRHAHRPRNLATSYWQAGRTTDAITLQETVLTDRERILGPEHPDTLTARHEPRRLLPAGGTHHRRDHPPRTVLTDRERLLGPEHPDTLIARNNLAVSYWQAGRTDDAITLQETVLTDRERLLGPEHPDTLTARKPRRLLPAGRAHR